MNSEIYYTHNDKPMVCKTDHHGRPDALAMNFHVIMQNEMEIEYYYVENGNMGRTKKSRKVIKTRNEPSSYSIKAMKKCDIWYDEAFLSRTPDVRGEKPPAKGFGDVSELSHFPERITS